MSWLYIAYGDVPVVACLFYGIKPAVIAIVVQAAHRIGTRALKNNWLWAIAVASFVSIFALRLPFPAIIMGAALIGYLGGRLAPAKFRIGGGHGAAQQSYGPAVIDDDTPQPDHAHFSWPRLLRVLAVGLALWLLPMSLLAGLYGWFTPMAWFFTKAALLTFGGAYAVLPYVFQGAVDHYGWLTPALMIDGLALGEITPGPLIMVAATLVPWFTFLPSFIFILAGGPLVESTRDELHLTAPMTAMTAAVVGVVFNLALFFGYHVLWPEGFSGHFEWPAAIIAVAAAIALLHYKRGVIPVIAACAVAGLAIQWWVR